MSEDSRDMDKKMKVSDYDQVGWFLGWGGCLVYLVVCICIQYLFTIIIYFCLCDEHDKRKVL